LAYHVDFTSDTIMDIRTVNMALFNINGIGVHVVDT